LGCADVGFCKGIYRIRTLTKYSCEKEPPILRTLVMAFCHVGSCLVDKYDLVYDTELLVLTCNKCMHSL
jgi:hypothetical protein